MMEEEGAFGKAGSGIWVAEEPAQELCMMKYAGHGEKCATPTEGE